MGKTTRCQRFSKILGGQAVKINNVCTSTNPRNDLKLRIEGQQTSSALALAEVYSYEPITGSYKALCLGQVPLYPDQVLPFTETLASQGGITVSSITNYWVDDTPGITYVHLQYIGSPILFAKKVSKARQTICL